MSEYSILKPLIHPSCFYDEFPIGYIIRLVESNKYQSSTWLMNESKRITKISNTFHYKTLKNIEWTGYNLLTEFSTYELLKSIYFDAKKLKFCSICISDKPYLKTKWQFRCSNICAIHKIWLSDCCVKCAGEISILRPRIEECRCGEKFKNQPKIVASLDMLKMQEFIESPLANGDISILENRFKIIDFFKNWNFKINHKLINSDGTSFQKWTDTAEALFAGRSGFFNFLNRLQEFENRSTQNIKHFERFHHDFYKKFPDEIFKIFRDLIEEYINCHWQKPLSGRNINFSQATLKNHPWIPLRAACRDYDISKGTFKRAFMTGLIRFRIEEKKKRKLTYVYRPDIDSRFFRIKDFITAKEATVLLGLTKQQFSQLKENGFFRVSISPQESGLGSWGFSREEILSFRDKTTRGLDQIKGDAWSLSHIFKYYGAQIDNSTLTIIEAIRDGHLKAVAVDANKQGLSSMYFSKHDFFKWLETRKSQRGAFGIPVVSKLLNVNQEFTYQLVNQGFLKTYKGCDGSRWIAKEALDEFKERFVILSKLAKLVNINSRTLTQYLASRSIYPVDHKTISPLRQKIYKKSDLVNIGILKGFLQ